jgi:hypothetical protein
MTTAMSRRGFVGYCGSVALVSASGSLAWATQTLAQRQWRYCVDCGVLFHQGSGRGKCPKNAEGHKAMGFEFVLDYTQGSCSSDTPRKQGSWRKCSKCLAMYWGKATPDSMKCVATGNRHVAATDRCFNLPTNRLHAAPLNPENNHAQGAWRFCGRCTAMFYDGYLDNKGVCPRGGAHAALGDFFVLSH